MGRDRERVAAFALLFLLADGPLAVLEALPPTGWALAVGPFLALLSWAAAGTYLVAAARATRIETRGLADLPWVVATLGFTVGLVALGPLVGGRPASPWTPAGAIGATTLLGLFWAVYLRGGGERVGPAPFRFGLRSLSLEDRVLLGGFFLGTPLGVALLVLLAPVPVGLFLVVGVGGLFGSYLVTMFWMGRRRRLGWEGLARGLGWDEPEDPGAVLEGVFRGRRARVGTIREAARWLTFWTTDARVEMDTAPDLELLVRPEGRLGRLQRALDARDAEVGRERFDERFLVDTDDQEVASRLFRSLGERLVDARGEVKLLLVEDGDLVAAHPGFVTDPERIRRSLTLLDRVAEVLEEAGGDEDIW